MKKNVQHIPIRISGVAEGQHDFDLHAEPADIGLPEEYPHSLAIHVHMDKTHSQIILVVNVTTSAVVPCDRCLDPVTVPVAQHFVLFYAHDTSAARLLNDDDVRIVDPNTPFIDIADDVRDYALLSIPMRRICGEDGDGVPLCKDLPAQDMHLSDEERVDPRWEKLLSMKTDE